ncbi:hypothetical protein F5146DRAFT_1156418 [Armillaria mellea]|nr:hypothetical protein F5146DRAFT_1156418 [Armillaria mellea]
MLAAVIPPRAWSSLNATIGGRLRNATPYARSCFSGSLDEGVCSGVINEHLGPARHSDHFGGYINTEWGTCQATADQCAVPSYYVDVVDHTDVAATFEFSRRTGIPVIVKNTRIEAVDREHWASGPLSDIFGLAVDRVLEYEIVVPTSDLLVANECQNPDLFFALRRRGGGTFDVVM